MARILLTGGSGFIGSQLARIATRSGHAVTVTSAINNEVEKRRCEQLRAAGISVAEVALDDDAGLDRVMPGHEIIIHLAAAQHEAERGETYFRKVNVEGTRHLLDAAVRANAGRFVYGSTIGVYGSADKPGTLDEQSPLAPDNLYGRTKAEAEKLVRTYADRIPVAIARISETYGPGDMRLLKLFRGISRGRFVTIGNGRNTHQLIYVDELVRGLLEVARNPAAAGETFVLAGSESLTTDQMVAAVAAAVERRKRIPHVPLWPFELAAIFFETTMKPLGLRPPLHRRRLDFFRKSFRFSTLKADRLLGFRSAVRFEEGARRTAAWYREQGLLEA